MYTTDVHAVCVGGGSGLDAVELLLLDDPFSATPPEPPWLDEWLDPPPPQAATSPSVTSASTTAAIVRRDPADTPNRRVELKRSGQRPGPAWRTARDHRVCVSQKC
jgi:hypothetical protein